MRRSRSLLRLLLFLLLMSCSRSCYLWIAVLHVLICRSRLLSVVGVRCRSRRCPMLLEDQLHLLLVLLHLGEECVQSRVLLCIRLLRRSELPCRFSRPLLCRQRLTGRLSLRLHPLQMRGDVSAHLLNAREEVRSQQNWWIERQRL